MVGNETVFNNVLLIVKYFAISSRYDNVFVNNQNVSMLKSLKSKRRRISKLPPPADTADLDTSTQGDIFSQVKYKPFRSFSFYFKALKLLKFKSASPHSGIQREY